MLDNFTQTKVIVSFINHETGDLLYQIDGAALSALKYDIKLNDISKAVFTLPYESWLDDVIDTPDTLVDIEREQDGVYYREKTYLLRAFEMFYDDEIGVESVVLGGLSLEHLLTRRCMRSNSDPIAAGGYITRTGEGSKLMIDFARYQIGSDASDVDRRIYELSMSYAGDGQAAGGRYKDDDMLFDVMQDISVRGDTDFEIIRQNGNSLLLKAGKQGADKTSGTASPVIFSRERGTLLKPKYKIDRSDEVTVIVGILGGAIGNRTIFESENPVAIEDSNWNRIEKPINIKMSRDDTALDSLTKAQAELADGQAKREFTFEIDAGQSGTLYRRDFVVGDTVTAKWRDGLTENLRVVGISASVDIVETMDVTVRKVAV